MSSIEFFMKPDEFYRISKDIFTKHDARIILRRFKTEQHESGWNVITSEADVADTFLRGGYTEAYFSLGAVPSHDRDFDFTDNAMDELLELDGGRLEGNDLELFTLRTFAKKSTADKLFKDLKKSIVSVCQKGFSHIGDTLYPNIYHAESAVKYCLYTDLKYKSHLFTINPPAETKGEN